LFKADLSKVLPVKKSATTPDEVIVEFLESPTIELWKGFFIFDCAFVFILNIISLKKLLKQLLLFHGK
jgi:hypothetical protein